MKNCWRCAEEIQDAAIECRFCNAAQSRDARIEAAQDAISSAKQQIDENWWKPFVRFLSVSAGLVMLLLLVSKCGGQSGGTSAPATQEAPVTLLDDAAVKKCESSLTLGVEGGLIIKRPSRGRMDVDDGNYIDE